MMEELEPRQLMSVSWLLTGTNGFVAFNGGGFPTGGMAQLAADPVIRADAQIVRNDMDKLAADQLALKDQLAADLKAIAAARKLIDLQPLRDQLKIDRAAWQLTIKGDRLAIAASRKAKDFAQLAIDRAKLKTDLADFAAAMKAGNLAIKNAVNLDPGVIAARQTYQQHLQIINDDMANLSRSWQVLLRDINYYRSTHPLGGGFTVSGSIGPDFIFGITTGQGYATNSNVLGLG
jgi:hypothetical protein